MISPSHGGKIHEHISWWRGTCPLRRDFPYLVGRAVLPGMSDWPHGFDSVENLSRAYPKLAEHCLGRDRGYVDWYRNMLQTTEPDGVIFFRACWDQKDSPINRTRVLTAEGECDVAVPLPPPGKCQLEWAAQGEPVLQETPSRLTRENVGRIRPGMALSEVRSILGDGRVARSGECGEHSGGTLVRRSTATLDWQAGSRRVTVAFENDTVLEVHYQWLE